MNQIAVIIGVIIFICFLLMIRMPTKLQQLFGGTMVRVMIALLVLFFVNVIGGSFGVHIPINVFTVAISSLLGISGVASLAAIHFYIL